jgi:ATP-dependent Clp protease ATP-binding subunit ClpA
MNIFKKRTLKEETEIDKLKKYMISLNGLYAIEIGRIVNRFDGISWKKYFQTDSFNLAIFHNGGYSDNTYYLDVFTNSKFYLYSNLNVKEGQDCCYNPISFASLIQKFAPLIQNSYIEILDSGYISMYDAIEILKRLNEKNNTNINSNTSNSSNKQRKESSNDSNNDKLPEGRRLNDKVYPHEPAIGRENEIKSVITTLASLKKSPILVGESGTGKTAIVDELVYKIQRNQVPNFLKDKEIIELDTSSIVAGTKYVGTLEEKMKNIISYASSHDSLLFIDEIHTIYGAGASSNNDNDIAEILKKAIERENIRIIGTTTKEEYQKYFSQDALKRRFEPTTIEEPNQETLFTITKQVLYNYSEDYQVSLENLEEKLDQIIDILIKATLPTCRDYQDSVNNPDLIISIIDKAFADAKINDQNELNIENIIYGISSCTRIYESVQERTIYELKNLKANVKKLGFNSNSIVPFKN